LAPKTSQMRNPLIASRLIRACSAALPVTAQQYRHAAIFEYP
jgi:hypothetical protein